MAFVSSGMKSLRCLLSFHDWRYWNASRRACSRCGRIQVRWPYDPSRWEDVH